MVKHQSKSFGLLVVILLQECFVTRSFLSSPTNRLHHTTKPHAKTKLGASSAWGDFGFKTGGGTYDNSSRPRSTKRISFSRTISLVKNEPSGTADETLLPAVDSSLEIFKLPSKLYPTRDELVSAAMDAASAGGRQALVLGIQGLEFAAEAAQKAQQAARYRADMATAVGRFYTAWNAGNIDVAVAQFSPNCTFEDATFYTVFEGARDLKKHLLLRSYAYDVPVKYMVDDIAVSQSRDKVAVKYHLEQDNESLANSRRCAFFTLDSDTKLIQSCFDVIEPVNKVGDVNLFVLRVASYVIDLGKRKVKNRGRGGILDSLVPKLELPQPLKTTGEALDRVTQQVISGIKQMSGPDPSPKAAKTPSSDDNGRGFDTPESLELTLSRLLGGGDPAKDSKTAPERYFQAWSRRDIDGAAELFTEDCAYEDTVFPKPFKGRKALQKHLVSCADAFPPTFRFIVDDVADGGDSIGVKWHVENNGEQLPFTRGCSFYNIDTRSGKIEEGFDELEPAVLKLGGPKLLFNFLKTKMSEEPERLLPLALWAAYMYIVFFSDGILPGANALQLEQRTWEEVRDLSLNFFLVSPLLNLPFSPVVHPILEGVFNLLLSWAALFAGFFSDERDDKPNLFPIIPAVVGMQFLTSAFYLPYIACRTTEQLPPNSKIYKEDLGKAAQVVESRFLGPFLGTVGAGSIIWGVLARQADFGHWNERITSFWNLMSIDRVGSSFLVDLVIFAAFQGWLVDDDLRRRGVNLEEESSALRNVAKYVPFFGLAAYMALRPKYPSRQDES